MKKTAILSLFFALFLIGFIVYTPLSIAVNPNFQTYIKGPHVDRVIFKYLTEEEQLSALKAGEINVSALPLQPGSIKTAALNPNIQVEANASFNIYYLVFNLKKMPFNNSTYNGKNIGKILRQAIAHAIDKEALTRSALKGWGTPIDSLLHIGYGIWHNPNIKKYDFNLTIATKILDDAGIVDTDNDSIRNDPRTGFDIVFYIEHPTQDYDPLRYTAGVMIAEWLQQIGLGAYSKPTGFMQLIYDTYIYQNSTVSLWERGSNEDFLSTLYWVFEVNPPGINIMGPYVGFQNTTFNELEEVIQSETDPQQLLQEVYESQVILAEELPVIPLFTSDRTYAHRIETVGWVNMPGGIMGRYGAKLSFLRIHSVYKTFGGFLYCGITSYPTSINPINATTDIRSLYIRDALWESLIQLNPDLGVEPDLASNWTVSTETIPAGTEHTAMENVFRTNTGNTTPIYVVEGGWSWEVPSEDINGTVITWYLRDGLKWSDGESLTAYDVNFTYYLMLNYENSSWDTNSNSGLGAVWKIEVINNTVIRIHIAMRDPFAVYRYSIYPLPAHIWAAHWNDANTWTMGFDTNNDTLIAESTVGSGPFVWSSHGEGAYINLVINPYYWNIPQGEEASNMDNHRLWSYPLTLLGIVVGGIVIVIAALYVNKQFKKNK